MTPDRERIIALNPDLILLSPYENASTYGNLESLGIPIIQCADYMETSALGRAEWMRLYGRLVGKAHVADSLFAAIEAEYDSLLTLTDSIEWECRPSVLFDTMIGSAWYVPGGRSTMAQLVSDAGGRYLFADNVKSGSVPLAFETVLDCGGQADYWLIRYNNSRQRMTLTDLGNIYQPYTLFKAYSKGEVYGCNSAELIFYEQTPFHPERLLLDYIKILHPALFSADSLRYFHRL
jgi:iron complex transport system substrate-binding protein